MDPNHAVAHSNLGTAYLNRGLYAQAAKHYERALALDFTKPDVLLNYSVCLWRTGHTQQAISTLENLLTQYPDEQKARQLLNDLTTGRAPS